MTKCRAITVLALGNVLLKDDGIGVWLLRELQKHNCSPRFSAGVSLHEVGTAAFNAPALVRDKTCVLLLDALQGGEKPGTVYTFIDSEKDRQQRNAGSFLSLHDFRLQDILFMVQPGEKRSWHIFGVEPGEIGFGYGLTPGLQEALPLLVDILVKEIVTLEKTIQTM